MLQLKTGLHHFPKGIFGSTSDLLHPKIVREWDTLMIACSGQGAAPDNVSFATPGRFFVLQHIGASIPSKAECDRHGRLSCNDISRAFDKYDFRHVIVCGHLGSRVIRSWLQPIIKGHVDVGDFRRRFERETRNLVDRNYTPSTATERCTLMVCEHVLCQIENLMTHPFIQQRVLAEKTSLHGWVIDDDTARVFGYCLEESAFALV